MSFIAVSELRVTLPTLQSSKLEKRDDTDETWVGICFRTGLGRQRLWMLIHPEAWYYAIPGVAGTGPANLHFIRDIGCAYLVVAASVLWLAGRPEQAWPAALAGGTFLTLHALVHLWDTAAGRESTHQLVVDLPAVILPAFLVLWLVWLARRDSKEE